MHCLTKPFMSLCQVKKFKILEHLLYIQHGELISCYLYSVNKFALINYGQVIVSISQLVYF